MDLLDHGFFNMSNAAVIIFDECHHVLGSKHPYRLIMHRYAQLTEGTCLKISRMLPFNLLTCEWENFFEVREVKKNFL